MSVQRRRGILGRGLSAWEQSNIVVGRAVPVLGMNDYLYVFPQGLVKVKRNVNRIDASMDSVISFFEEFSNVHRVTKNDSTGKMYDLEIRSWNELLTEPDYYGCIIWLRPFEQNGNIVQSTYNKYLSAAALTTDCKILNSYTRKPNVMLDGRGKPIIIKHPLLDGEWIKGDVRKMRYRPAARRKLNKERIDDSLRWVFTDKGDCGYNKTRAVDEGRRSGLLSVAHRRNSSIRTLYVAAYRKDGFFQKKTKR